MNNKTVVLGVTGGIAVYKACDLVSSLRKLGIEVHVIMTKSASEFVTPMTFQTMSQNFVTLDMFEEPKTWDVEHIALAKKADVFVVAPATANIIGKMANGIADDMLSTTLMATRAPILVAPAMNTNMYSHPVTQENINKLERLGYKFVEPASGRLACGDEGKGKLAPVEEILKEILKLLNPREKDLEGKKVLITAGPTMESLDPVRFLTNRSSGKMGYAIAKAAVARGAKVTLVSGKTNQTPPVGLDQFIPIESAVDMYKAVMENLESSDIIIKSAAVADYRPKNVSDKKIKKTDGDLVIELERNPDILMEVGKKKGSKVLVGFAAETNDLIENATKKVQKKNLDFIVANDLTKEGAGFGVDTNIVKILHREGKIEELPIMEKEALADEILDRAKALQR